MRLGSHLCSRLYKFPAGKARFQLAPARCQWWMHVQSDFNPGQPREESVRRQQRMPSRLETDGETFR